MPKLTRRDIDDESYLAFLASSSSNSSTQATNTEPEQTITTTTQEKDTTKDKDSTKPLLKTNFKLVDKIESLYTGGAVAVFHEGNYIVSSSGGSVTFVHLDNGKKLRLNFESGTITALALHPKGTELITSHSSQQLQQWGLDPTFTSEPVLRRKWKFEGGLHLSAAYDSTGNLLAVAGTDYSVRVWDVKNNYWTHMFRKHTANVTLVQFHPSKFLVISAAEDGAIFVWDLLTKESKQLKNHLSRVTGIAFTPDEKTLISGGRDRVISIWDFEKSTLLKTFPVFSSIETLAYLIPAKSKKQAPESQGEIQEVVVAGSESGVEAINIGNGTKRSLIASTGTASSAYVNQLHVLPSRQELLTVTSDHFLLFYSLSKHSLKNSLVGFNDEIIDLRFATKNKLVAATNSELIRVYSIPGSHNDLLSGHTDLVIALDVSLDGSILASGSKDNTVRVWDLNQKPSKSLLGVLEGHVGSVTAVIVAPKSKSFVLSASADRTLKEWNIKKMQMKESLIAHEKEINALAISPNEKLIATGSEDRLIKLWTRPSQSGATIELKLTLKGHKRAIWSLCFSPVEQILASAGADALIRLWNINDGTCLKTLESHTNTVLRICFISSGMQLLSAGSEGILKLWTLRSGECIKSIEASEGKIWSLALSRDEEKIAIGGADSVISIWNDATEEELRVEAEKQKGIERDLQNLSNAMLQKDYVRAIRIATKLKQPQNLYKILEALLEDAVQEDQELAEDDIEIDQDLDDDNVDEDILSAGEKTVIRTLQKLTDKERRMWLKFVREWNTNARQSFVAQKVLSCFLRTFPPSYFSSMKKAKELFDGLLPYSQRHSQRVDRLITQSFFIDHLLNSMQVLLPEADEIDVDAVDESQNLSLSKKTIPTPEEKTEEEPNQSKKRKSGKPRHKKNRALKKRLL